MVKAVKLIQEKELEKQRDETEQNEDKEDEELEDDEVESDGEMENSDNEDDIGFALTDTVPFRRIGCLAHTLQKRAERPVCKRNRKSQTPRGADKKVLSDG